MFAVFVACGQTLVSLGISTKSFVLIIVGRTVSAQIIHLKQNHRPVHNQNNAIDLCKPKTKP